MYYVLKFTVKNRILLNVKSFFFKEDCQTYLKTLSDDSHYIYKTYFALDSDLLSFLENKGDLISL